MSGQSHPPGPLWGIGEKVIPPRFLLFIAAMLATIGWSLWFDDVEWQTALVRAFNLAAIVFAISLWPLSRDHTAAQMRLHSAQNEAGRGLVLMITCIVIAAILAALIIDLPPAKDRDQCATAKLIVTLAMAWGFTNLVFMLHYAHAHYGPADSGAGHRGGFEFPGTPAPDYWDFLYFSFTAGMSFAASDVNVTRSGVRRVVLVHCLLSFIFNIGVIAFTINALS